MPLRYLQPQSDPVRIHPLDREILGHLAELAGQERGQGGDIHPKLHLPLIRNPT